jgi:hypothetical protein
MLVRESDSWAQLSRTRGVTIFMKNEIYPIVNLLHSSMNGPVPFHAALLKSCIPQTRPVSSGKPHSGITYQAYMSVLSRFVIRRRDFFLQTLVEKGFDSRIRTMDLVAEKHGSQYHPSRIVVKTREACLAFVANVALTEASRKRLEDEFRVFGRLRQKISTDFIPRMYLLDEAALDESNTGSSRVLIMLGEWLEGFHEFHLSACAKGDPYRTILWDTDQGYTFLSDHEAAQIYYKAAFILTTFYDPETFEEVFPWHQASGDFVAARDNAQMVCKLITVRQYAPRLEFHEHRPENQVTAMLLFLANLTIRMRLDRLEGVGETVWAGDGSVEATIKGFLDALRRKVENQECDTELSTHFLRTVRQLSPAELTEVFRTIVESYDPVSPDVPVIRHNLGGHIFAVYKAIQRVL